MTSFRIIPNLNFSWKPLQMAHLPLECYQCWNGIDRASKKVILVILGGLCGWQKLLIHKVTIILTLHSFKLFWIGVPVNMIRRLLAILFTARLVVDFLFFITWPSSHTTKSAPTEYIVEDLFIHKKVGSYLDSINIRPLISLYAPFQLELNPIFVFWYKIQGNEMLRNLSAYIQLFLRDQLWTNAILLRFEVFYWCHF